MVNNGDKDAFSQRMVDILNHGALNLALGIGYRLGLFEVLDALEAPAGTADIAARANLSERYHLPRAHGDMLCRRAGNDNLGVYTQEIPLLTHLALEAVCRGFETGNGVPFEHYPRFQVFMSELASAKHRQVLVETFLPSVDGGRLIDRLHQGIQVCDLGCGEGVALNLMAHAFPASRFIGVDMDAEGLEAGRREAAALKLDNVCFEQADAARLTEDTARHATCDYITAFDAVHDQTRPLAALRGVLAMLRPGGLFSMVDIAAESAIADNRDHPMAPFLYAVSLMHCMPVGLAGSGTGLGMMWGRQRAVALLQEAGFGQVEVRAIPEDPFNLHFECRP